MRKNAMAELQASQFVRSVRITGERQTSAIEKYTQLRMCFRFPTISRPRKLRRFQHSCAARTVSTFFVDIVSVTPPKALPFTPADLGHKIRILLADPREAA